MNNTFLIHSTFIKNLLNILKVGFIDNNPEKTTIIFKTK